MGSLLFRTQGSVFSYILASIANDSETGSADRAFHVDTPDDEICQAADFTDAIVRVYLKEDLYE